jgi:serine/threonine protein kinase
MHVPPKIPGYELLQPLGGGPLTCVYSGRECSTDTLCAVKLLRDEWHEQSTAIKLLQREARAGLAVRHPHLVRLRHVHVTRPPYYLVMDLLAGESLRRRLRRDYRVDVPTALWIGRQTAEALAALHRAGYLHGDVKPDNIRLIDAGTAVLIDLGFAHRPGENAALRRQGYILGTVNYLAPELCGGDADADFRSDWFSLGVTLFEMLTGRLPYPAGTIEQTMRRHHAETPLDIRQHASPLPAPLAALVDRLLQRHPGDRPRAAAVIQQLIALEIAALRRRQAG